MSDGGGLSREVTDRQIAMFRMFVGPGLYTTRAALSAASAIPESTLKDRANGAAMPLHEALVLRRFLPTAAINMLTEPGNARLVDIETSDANWDGVAAKAAALTAEICEARSDGMITPAESSRLKTRTREVIAECQSAVETG